MAKFDHKKTEKKWQEKWETDGMYSPDTIHPGDKFYNLWMFPYPSAEGLHAGHAFASTGSDAYGRFERMRGKTVFQPIGYDSFGIHSENYAIKIDQLPQEVVKRTTKHYEEQMRALGHGYDWTRTVTTSSPEYYKWTQWLFIKMWEAGLAYKQKASVNFCPSCKTVLADEQVMTPKQAGKEPKDAEGNIVPDTEDIKVCERCGTVVEKRDLDQWFFKITDYADRLLANLEKIDWSEKVKIAQKEWIGKKTGITINYPIKDGDGQISCFTTRPDTNFGATFIVCSPEYARDNLLKIINDDHKVKITKYIEVSLNKTEQQRKEGGREKTGEFTGLHAINNLNGREIPVYVSDFVLSGFGTGAVVGVPGHDKRDFEFATKFGLPIERVVVASNGDESEIVDISQVQEEEGMMVNSEFLNGMPIVEAITKMMDYLEERHWGARHTNYHLRDWLVSRQRYWGAPIPMINCDKCGWVPVPESDLPVLLPEIADYKPKGDGKGPLAAHKDFYDVSCPKCAGAATRETDVIDTFVDSSWYFLRYPSIGAKSSSVMPFDAEITKKWLPVDLYFGGAEHSVLHLMYARFVTMVLYDHKHIEFEEPFNKFFAHGLMIKDGAKMSKSRGNVVNPDEYIEKFGADTLRLYLMFMGPMDGYPDFRDSGIEGMQRFVNRVWSLYENTGISLSSDIAKRISVKTHKTIKKVSEEMENFRFNTAIASIMELVNEMKSSTDKSENGDASPEWEFALRVLCQMLAPFTPHMGEEIWVERLREEYSVHTSPWPSYDEALTVDETVKIPVQVNGKLRGVIEVTSDDSENKDICIKLAREDEAISKWVTGIVKKQVYIPGKLINFVI